MSQLLDLNIFQFLVQALPSLKRSSLTCPRNRSHHVLRSEDVVTCCAACPACLCLQGLRGQTQEERVWWRERERWVGERREDKGVPVLRQPSFLNFSFLLRKTVNNKMHILTLFWCLRGMIYITCFPQGFARLKLLRHRLSRCCFWWRFISVASLPSTCRVLDPILWFLI